MRLRVKVVIFPTIIAFAFVVAPRIAIGMLPVGVEEMVGIVFDFNVLISTLTMVGIVLAASSFVKNTTDVWSPVNLLASIASELVGLYIFIFFMGLGEVAGLGVTRKLIPAGPGATMLWDFRFFVLFSALISGLTIVRDGLKFYYSRKEHAAQLPTHG